MENRLIANERYTEKELLEMDEKHAIKKGYTFAVATKAEKGQPWQTVYENLISLKHALRLTQEIKDIKSLMA